MKWIVLTPLLILSTYICAQDFQIKGHEVGYTDESFEIDGLLDEPQWARQSPATDFYQYFPTDSLLAELQTEIYLYADDKNLYVGIKCYGESDLWRVNSLKRDYRAGGNDNITLVFDTFDDKTNAIFFGINPKGVIREGVISNGGNGFRDFSESWDNKWRGEAVVSEGYYTAELEIPFTTLRYDKANDQWGLLVYRFDTQKNESSVWNRVPRNQPLFNLAYTGPMTWERPLQPSKKQISLIPFITGGISKDFEAGTPASITGDVGGDIKVGVTSGLNLDVTINPDFSQVEVDRQQTNLTRFEIFFPERRQFFIENADLFGNFGFSQINPFFSRRIGVGQDTTTGLTVQNRILGGARLSGKLNTNTRIGLLNMQTAADDLKGLKSTNFSVAVLQQKIWDRSNVSFIAVNRQSFQSEVSDAGDNFNRVFGGDFNYASKDNTWFGKTFLHASFDPGDQVNLAHGTLLNYNKRHFRFSWEHQIVPEDYNAEVGFIRRTNYVSYNPDISVRFYPQNDFINEWRIGLNTEILTRPGFGRTDHTYNLSVQGQLSNSGRFTLGINHDYIFLFNDFDPTGTESEPLAADTGYNFVSFFGNLGTDRRKNIVANTRVNFGEYFNGWRGGVGGTLTFRYQPRGSIDLNYNWNIFSLPHLDGIRQTLLVGPRIDYTFSKSLFATVFVQYNTQAKNTNINTRIQWRFAPVSDLFIVFTENYFTGNPGDPSDRFTINIRNRALVAKFTYWINV